MSPLHKVSEEEWDSQKVTDIARRLGLHPGQVYHFRRNRKRIRPQPGQSKKGKVKPLLDSLSNTDWETRSRQSIADQIGCTVQAVYTYALENNKPHRQQGGKRENAGRKPSAPTATHPVRCTDEGWTWLQAQASGRGHTSVGKWADSKGRKAPKRKGKTPSYPTRL